MTYNMKKFLAFYLVILSFLLPGQAFAQYVPTPSTKVVINKTVLSPNSTKGGTGGNFVDNMSVTDQNFLSGQEVVFRIQVSNPSQVDANNLLVTDMLPKELSFVSGGNFNSTNNSVNFNIGTLKAGDTNTFEVHTKVNPSDQLASAISCPTNLAQVKTDNMLEQDTSTFCISKTVMAPVQELPKTGNATNLVLGGSIFALLISTLLYRKSKV